MPLIFENLDSKKEKEVVVLAKFVQIYCSENHRDEAKEAFDIKDKRLRKILSEKNIDLCSDCSKLLNHGIAKLMLCPYQPKPSCKKCETHCYAPGYREKVRKVMRFSGIYSIKHGRVDLIKRYWF